MSTNCTDLTLGVTARIVTASIGATRCERWDMTYYETPGSYRNHWNCDCFFPLQADRQVAYVIGVTTSNASSPRWNLAYGFRGG